VLKAELGTKGRERIKPAELGVGASTREAIDRVVALGEQHAARRLPFQPSLATHMRSPPTSSRSSLTTIFAKDGTTQRPIGDAVMQHRWKTTVRSISQHLQIGLQLVPPFSRTMIA
jgi:hypothetical protein